MRSKVMFVVGLICALTAAMLYWCFIEGKKR